MNYLVADVPDRPVSFLIGLGLMEQLRKIGQRGVLYGRTDTTDGQRTLVTIEACQPGHELAPVGLVRSWVRGHLYLDKEDRSALGGPQAVQPYSILLVVKPARMGVPSAGAFLCESGAVTSENSFVEFPLDRARILSSRFAVLKDAGAPAPEIRKPSVSRRAPLRMPRWTWIPAGVALLALFAVFLRQSQVRGHAPDAIERSGPARILLSLQRAGNDLLLRWDPDNPTIRAADHAVLRITDGDMRRNVPLDSSQLQVGAAQYHPVSNDVEFQLDIPGANGASSDPVRFISGPPAVPKRAVAANSSELPGETVTKGESERAHVESASRPRSFNARSSNTMVQIGYEPMPPSAIRKAVNKVRGVPLLRFRSGDFVAPQATHQVTPLVSPATAGQISTDRRLELRANIDKNGRVTNVQPLSPGADKQLVAMSESAIRRWQFKPARLNNRPVGSSVRFTVRVENSKVASLPAR